MEPKTDQMCPWMCSKLAEKRLTCSEVLFSLIKPLKRKKGKRRLWNWGDITYSRFKILKQKKRNLLTIKPCRFLMSIERIHKKTHGEEEEHSCSGKHQNTCPKEEKINKPRWWLGVLESSLTSIPHVCNEKGFYFPSRNPFKCNSCDP